MEDEAETTYLMDQLEIAGNTLYDICEATNTEWLDGAAFPVDTIKRKWQALGAEAKVLQTAIRDIREGFEPEWVGDGQGPRWCAFCNMLEADGHTDDCFWTVIKTVDDRVHCPECDALIPPDGNCWYCENDPCGEGPDDDAGLRWAGAGVEEVLADGDAIGV